MILAKKLTYFLTVTCSFFWCLSSDFDLSKADDSEDDDKLKQALFLVDILKSEYFKVLRENYNLKNGVISTTEVPVEETATCALNETLPESSLTAGNTTGVSGSSTQGFTVPAGQDSSSLEKANRRFFNIINDNVDTNKTTTTADSSTSPRISSSVSNYDSTVQNNNYLRSNGNPSVLLAAAEFQTAPEHLKIKAILDVDSDFHMTNSLKDPVLRQVASELMSELKEDDALRSQDEKKWTTPKNNSKTLFRFHEFQKLKTTMKIHLEKSSKLPIPLPENNAFCYFHPKSLLCRSSL